MQYKKNDIVAFEVNIAIIFLFIICINSYNYLLKMRFKNRVIAW